MRPGGRGDRTALSLDGRSWTYAEFAELVLTVAREQTRPDAAPWIAPTGGGSAVEVLATVFAAAAAGRPVLVADPAAPAPALSSDTGMTLPAGTFLVVVTSGSTGLPRPVLRTAASWAASLAPFTEVTGIGPDDRVLLTGPLHATLHLFAAVHTLWLGAELTDDRRRATAVHAVPTVLADLVRVLPTDAPLRTAVVAGAALPDEVADAAAARGIAVTEYYGAAELSFVAARRWPGPLHPFPGADVRLQDRPDSSPASGARVLWVRSPYLAIGYAPGIDGPFQRDDEGFATVGDLAEWTADGGLLIRGRGDVAITTGGATVIAEDVERRLSGLAGVAAVAVLGVPHRRLGQLVTAVIQPMPGADLAGVRAAARLVLHGQALPRRWLLTDRLPTTPNGKVARAAVALAAARLAAGEPPLDGAIRLRPLP